MTRAARLLIPQGEMIEAVRAGYEAGTPIVLTTHALLQLQAEIGGDEQKALEWLRGLIKGGSRPIGLNLPKPGGGTVTVFLGRDGWTLERLRGHVATMAPSVAAEFGPLAPGEATR